MKRFLMIAAAFAVLPLTAPAHADERVLTIFGKDSCPEGNICVRAPESDRYRIPKRFRSGAIPPANQSWAARAGSTLDVGATGAGSCSAVGGTGWTGCYMQQMRQARAERKQQAAENASVP